MFLKPTDSVLFECHDKINLRHLTSHSSQYAALPHNVEIVVWP